MTTNGKPAEPRQPHQRPYAVNVYRCESRLCGGSTITVDRDWGVTPFITKCRQCNEAAAQSMGYRVPQALEPTHEWYRPTPEEIERRSPGDPDMARHFAMGGLVLRRIKSHEEWEAEFLAAQVDE